jgi:predicted metalloendopeptidase
MGADKDDDAPAHFSHNPSKWNRKGVYFEMTRWILALAASASLLTAADIAGSGIDRSSMDEKCKPCDDFFRYVNGGWLDKNPIPARYSNWGTFTILNEGNRERLKVILEAASLAKNAPGSPEQKIGDLYAACMDTAYIDSLGVKPVQPDLDRIAAIKDVAGLKDALRYYQVYGNLGPFGVGGGPDLKDVNQTIAIIGAGGLSLPDRDYYFKEDERTKKVRDEFLAHVERTMMLLGDSKPAAAAAAKTVMAFETALAEKTLTNVQRRDPYSQYHKMDLAAVAEIAPGFDWKALFADLRIPESSPVNVSQPEFLKLINIQFTAVPLDDWKTWLRWRLISSASPLLSKPFVDESFRFRGAVLTGTKEQLPRWQTCTNTVDGMLGDALGQAFVARHFPPAARKRMDDLIENLRATLRETLETADWLSPETRASAVAKLNSFKSKIGYPDKWRSYADVKIERRDYFGDVRSAALAARLENLAKIGKPVDRTEWGMTPPTVNAYYRPTWNEIAFPAGILQRPFFDMDADDAVNYGAIGAVIGHEMGHGFDDQGSKFDASGNLKNWWTPEDRKKFEERAGCVIDQFNTLDVGENLRHNGKLVVGEALGDLGGLKLAYYAWKRSLRGKPEPPVVDGFTAEQRFFLAFGRIWARAHTPEDLRLRLNTDPHPIARFRAIGTLQNTPEFHKAFGCKQGDPMVRPVEKQCKLW